MMKKLAIVALTAGLVPAVAVAQGYAPPWGPPAYLIERYNTRPPHYGGYPGYRLYDQPLNRPSDVLPPRWSDPRAQWPRDYRYRRECWFRAEC
jgi:hypothetical protein